MRTLLLTLLTLLPVPLFAQAVPAPRSTTTPMSANQRPDPRELVSYYNYNEVIRKTVRMVQNPQAQQMARRHDLNILIVTW
jgi:hypothetical protein